MSIPRPCMLSCLRRFRMGQALVYTYSRKWCFWQQEAAGVDQWMGRTCTSKKGKTDGASELHFVKKNTLLVSSRDGNSRGGRACDNSSSYNWVALPWYEDKLHILTLSHMGRQIVRTSRVLLTCTTPVPITLRTPFHRTVHCVPKSHWHSMLCVFPSLMAHSWLDSGFTMVSQQYVVAFTERVCSRASSSDSKATRSNDGDKFLIIMRPNNYPWRLYDGAQLDYMCRHLGTLSPEWQAIFNKFCQI
jgi:hypothetical protein